MRLKLYCNRFAHFKDVLVCSVNCPYRARCQDFALYYDAHRDEIDTSVAAYFDAQRAKINAPKVVENKSRKQSKQVVAEVKPQPLVQITPAQISRALIRLEIKKVMSEAAFIWVDKEDRAELVEMEEVLKRAAHGAKPKHIYKVAQEMELRFQLVPRQRIEKAKRKVAVDAERAAARRTRNTNASTIQNTKETIPANATNEMLPNPRLPQRTRRANQRTLKNVENR
ncbi:MAG: hypothetical protein NVSMB56_14280 [Pyrinomonadaceae bacterium]